MKKCKECKEVKPKAEYWKMAKAADGLQYRCKPCALASRKKYATPSYRKKAYLKNTYGISKEEYEMMFARQDSRCALCHIDASDTPRGLFVDHCHESGQVRDLLCLNCNTALGHFKDNPQLMEKGAQYVKDWKPYRETEGNKEPCRPPQGRRDCDEGVQAANAELPEVSEGAR